MDLFIHQIYIYFFYFSENFDFFTSLLTCIINKKVIPLPKFGILGIFVDCKKLKSRTKKKVKLPRFLFFNNFWNKFFFQRAKHLGLLLPFKSMKKIWRCIFGICSHAIPLQRVFLKLHHRIVSKAVKLPIFHFYFHHFSFVWTG